MMDRRVAIVAYAQTPYESKKGQSREMMVYEAVKDLLEMAGIGEKEVEAVLVNGTVRPFHHVLADGDRVAAIPPGTPGPYRMLLGMIKNKD